MATVYDTMRAAYRGNLDELRRLHEAGCPWNANTIYVAAEFGQLHCLRYALEHGCEVDEYACTGAASNGHLDCLRYLHEHNVEWDANTTYRAALNGQLHCLRYAMEHGCRVNGGACDWAAYNGHLDCLTYLHEHNAPWDGWALMVAARRGHLECLKFMVESRCPFASRRWGDEDDEDEDDEVNFLNDDDYTRVGWPIHANCIEYVNTIRTADHWLRFVKPALETDPIFDASGNRRSKRNRFDLTQLVYDVYKIIDDTMHIDHEYLVDRDINETLELQEHL